jgi:hypothetical protein
VPLNAIRRKIIGWGCALSVVLPSAGALADGSPAPAVVVVRPKTSDAPLAEALTRIEAELRVAGFDVTIVSTPRDADAHPPIAETTPAATIGISGDAATGLEFRIANHRTGQTVIRRMAPEGETGRRAPEILANYAVELLLASLAEIDIKPASPETPTAPPPTPPPVTPVAPPEQKPRALTAAPISAPKPPRFGFEPGVGVAINPGGLAAALLPIARMQYAIRPAFQLRLTAAGLGTRPEISGDAGTAKISQAIVLVEAIARPYESRWGSPKVSAGAGAHYLGVEGRAAEPLEGLSASLWSAAVDFGAGVSSGRTSAFELSVEAHAVFAFPYPRVRFVDEQKASAGRPTLLLTATVIGWL